MPPPTADRAAPRLRRPQRDPGQMYFETLDQRLPADHLARALWQVVTGLDLTPLYQSIKAVAGHVGRDATDPHLLPAVWLYAFAQGETSARPVARHCTSDRAYEWLCGGVTLNQRLLGDFRVDH